MGYRNYIYTIPKKDYNKIKSLTKEQFYDWCRSKGILEDCEDEEPYVPVWELGIELHNFGDTDVVLPKKGVLPFFKKSDVALRFGHYQMKVISPQILEYIVEHYSSKVEKYYKGMAEPFFGVPNKFKASEFLNSVKTEYNFPNSNHTFDFSKITQEEQNALYKILEHVRSFRMEWVGYKPYNLENNSQVITTSWKFEYNIFELVRIYKTFDWKKNVMFYCGW